jgi:hypothetical protein
MVLQGDSKLYLALEPSSQHAATNSLIIHELMQEPVESCYLVRWMHPNETKDQDLKGFHLSVLSGDSKNLKTIKTFGRRFSVRVLNL